MDAGTQHRCSGLGQTERASALRLFLVEDHALVREGVRALLESQPDLHVVGEAPDGRVAQSVLPKARADLVLMDVSMPRQDGIQTTAWLQSALPDVQVIALTMREDRFCLQEMLQAGARGYLLKRSPGAELLRAIRLVAAGQFGMDPALGGMVARSLLETPYARKPPGRSPLSLREETVLRLVAEGFANKEIAAQLKIGIKTMETYKARGMEKLEMDGRTDLIRHALLAGWLQAP